MGDLVHRAESTDACGDMATIPAVVFGGNPFLHLEVVSRRGDCLINHFRFEFKKSRGFFRRGGETPDPPLDVTEGYHHADR